MKIIAHRGAGELAPENTMPAFDLAIKLGADAIEFDLHQSKDGELFIHHNYALGKPDNGRGLIYELKKKDIQSADAGSWFSEKYANISIPTLDQVMSFFAGKCQWEIELKGSTIVFLDTVIDTLNKFHVLEDVKFTSPHIALLVKSKEKYPKVKCGMFFESFPEWMDIKLRNKLITDYLTLSKIEVAHMPPAILDKELVNLIHQRHKLVHAADCNNRTNLLKAKRLGVDQISTDNIILAKELLL